MKRQAKGAGRLAGCALAVLLAGCAGQSMPPAPTTAQSEVAQSLPGPQPSQRAMPNASDWVPPLFVSPEEEASYYVSRLSDRRFVSSYGDHNNSRTWYIAAERLGQIGLPAVPLLFARLDTRDDYELMLVLYALQLATQDPLLMSRTRNDYIQLSAALDPSANAENARIAQQWWQQHARQLN